MEDPPHLVPHPLEAGLVDQAAQVHLEVHLEVHHEHLGLEENRIQDCNIYLHFFLSIRDGKRPAQFYPDILFSPLFNYLFNQIMKETSRRKVHQGLASLKVFTKEMLC